MDASKITEFLSKIEKTIKQNRGNNSRGGMFARLARELVLSAYTVEGKVRLVGEQTAYENNIHPADTSKADKLMNMSFEDAIYGAGRYLLHK